MFGFVNVSRFCFSYLFPSFTYSVNGYFKIRQVLESDVRLVCSACLSRKAVNFCISVCPFSVLGQFLGSDHIRS